MRVLGPMIRTMAVLWLANLAGCAAPERSCGAPDNRTRVAAGGECLVIRTFPAKAAAPRPVLYVVLHGDGSDGGPSVYHYGIAEQLAAAGPPGAVAVALIRPGYFDDQGHASSGSNRGRRDNYTPETVAAIAAAIDGLKRHYAASRVVAVAHSGGAAIAGVILGRYPHLLDGAVLVACPCNVAQWRGLRGASWPNSQSPSTVAPLVPAGTGVVAVSGTDDTVTPGGLARDYVDSLAQRGVDARFVPVPGASHNAAFRSPLVIAAAARLASPP